MKIFLSLLVFFLINHHNLAQDSSTKFSFVLAADMRDYTGDDIDYFRGACEAIKELGKVEFVISPGDIDNPDLALRTLKKYISNDIIWYPVVGNHEAETQSDMEWMRNFNKQGNSLPYIVNKGPDNCVETTYSFDFGNTHFVILNEYCNDNCDDCSDGDVPELLFNWLKNDLEKTRMKNKIVIGHEPAYPMPDMENQRFRHSGDCLNLHPENRDRFVKLLQKYEVIAYIVGHTHDYSIVKINNLWHIDVGHARGLGDDGTRSTFVKIDVENDILSYKTYRLNFNNNLYEITDTGILN